jgi:hypothetical protein
MLYIIGDSHTFRLRNSIGLEGQDHVDGCTWKPDSEIFQHDDSFNYHSDCVMFHVTKSKNLPVDVYFSGHRGGSAYSCSYTRGEYPCIKKTITKDFTVFPFFGYIDIKAHLPHQKNTEVVIKNYIEKTLNFFEGYKLQFIEPIPQFINPLGSGNPNYDFQSRFPYHKEYKYFLRKYLKEFGLKEPISTEDILGVDRLDESFECHECIDCLDPRFINFKLDHLKQEFNKKILDEIVREFS